MTPAGSHLSSVYISQVYLSKCVTTPLEQTEYMQKPPHPDYTCDCLTFTHSLLAGATQGGHSCLLFKEEEETCQEKIVKNRKLSWLESPSFLLASMNAASSQSFTPKDSIMITVIATTFLLCYKHPAWRVHVLLQHGIRPRYVIKPSGRCEQWMTGFKWLYAAWHFCLANVYTLPKLTPHPAATNPLL